LSFFANGIEDNVSLRTKRGNLTFKSLQKKRGNFTFMSLRAKCGNLLKKISLDKNLIPSLF